MSSYEACGFATLVRNILMFLSKISEICRGITFINKLVELN
jgi:hypothetical protein